MSANEDAAANATEVSRSASAKTPITHIALRQGGCFGTCPVYDMSVAPSGDVVYTGKRYAPYQGRHLGTLAADTLAKLLRLSEEVLAKADQLPREIDTGIADHAYSNIKIFTATDTLEFVGTTDFAPPVDELRRTLLQVPKEVDFLPDPTAPAAPKGEARIQLRSPDQIQVVQEEFYRQQFKVLAVEDAEEGIYRVGFDPYTMTPDEMLSALQARPEVQTAELIK